VKNDQDELELVGDQEDQEKAETSRRDFLRLGGVGLAGLAGAAALAGQPSEANAKTRSSGKKRIVILADSKTHMMPALALEMVRRDHDLVLGNAKDGLADELRGLGAKVEVVPNTADQTKPDTIQKLVDRAMDAFGRFDSACIRTGTHGGGGILNSTVKDLDNQYEGNIKSVYFALQALLPPLIEQKSGQVVINTSSAAMRPQPFVALYCATRAGANALIRAAGLDAGQHGVQVNGTGTYGMDYYSFLHDVGADTDPAKRKEQEDMLPLRKLVQPEDAANFVAALIDGRSTAQTAQYFNIDSGWSYM
jgi:NAD(P)-dependent dehydrogenase (short-subunit alcohol dehydrogenase family)